MPAGSLVPYGLLLTSTAPAAQNGYPVALVQRSSPPPSRRRVWSQRTTPPRRAARVREIRRVRVLSSAGPVRRRSPISPVRTVIRVVAQVGCAADSQAEAEALPRRRRGDDRPARHANWSRARSGRRVRMYCTERGFTDVQLLVRVVSSGVREDCEAIDVRHVDGAGVARGCGARVVPTGARNSPYAVLSRMGGCGCICW